MVEIWKDIQEHEGLYQISEFGVKSLKRKYCTKERVLKPKINSGGYPFVTLYNGISKQKTIHRLIAIHFIPNPENKPCINHKNGIKTDFRIINLEWCTYSENHLHAYKTGLRIHHNIGKFGKDHHSSSPVLQYSLDSILLAEYDGLRDASRETGVNKGNMSMACNSIRKTAGGFIWKYKNSILGVIV